MKRRELRDEAERIEYEFSGKVRALHSRESQLAQELKQLVTNRPGSRVEDRLRKVWLADIDKSGQSIRSGALRQAGLVTLFDLFRMRNQLERIPGIGAVTAKRLREILGRASVATPEDSRFYSDPTNWNANDYAFVATLIKLERIRQAKAISDAADRASKLTKIASELKSKTGVVAFLNRTNRESAEAMHRQLQKIGEGTTRHENQEQEDASRQQA